MLDKTQLGMCGAYCGDCGWKESTNCQGCQACGGKMFWGTCEVALCCIEKGITHCGLCPDLPCEKLQQVFDHPDHGDRGQRLVNLKAWAKGEDTFIPLVPKKGENE